MKIVADLAGDRLEWNLSNQDTLGTEGSALISGGVLYINRVYGTDKCVLIKVFSFRGVLIKGVLISGCPNKGLLISG